MPFLKDNEFFLLMDNPFSAPQEDIFAHKNMPPTWQEVYKHIDLEGLKKLRDVGIQTTMPFTTIWKEIEREPGVFDWSYFDGYIERASQAGMKVLLFGVTAGYPEWLPDAYFIQTQNREVQRSCMSPWNPEGLEAMNEFNKRIVERYSSDDCLVVNSQLSCGETVLINEPAFYDPLAIASFQRFSDSEDLPDPADNLTNQWLLDSYLKMLVGQQEIFIQNKWREIFLMLHPAIADFQGLYGNGCNWIEDILAEYTRKLEGVKINHIYYTWIQWNQYWARMGYWRAKFNENVFGGGEYAEGLPMTTPHAIQQGLRGQIISPCYPGIHDNGVEDWMLNNIRTAQSMWEQSRIAS